MTWDPNIPYNDLPLLPPVAEFDTKAILKSAIEARAALAALDQAAQRFSNPTVLVNSLSLLEAKASSEIENIVTTTDELFAFAENEHAATNPETKETLRYRAALFAGIHSMDRRPLSANTAIEVCSLIHGRDVGVRTLPGTIIGTLNTGQTIYTPPVGAAVINDTLSNWERFIHESPDLDPLIRMAVAHYQFEAIHPFTDGNGRTGRIMNVLLLIDAGLMQHPVLYLSRYFSEHRSDYYRLLLNVTAAKAWEPWILFVLDGVKSTARSTMAKVDSIAALQQSTMNAIRDTTKAGANADLLAVLFEQPYSRITTVMERCQVTRPTAASWLNALIAASVLVDVRVGRERLFINTAFVKLLMRDDKQ